MDSESLRQFYAVATQIKDADVELITLEQINDYQRLKALLVQSDISATPAEYIASVEQKIHDYDKYRREKQTSRPTIRAEVIDGIRDNFDLPRATERLLPRHFVH